MEVLVVGGLGFLGQYICNESKCFSTDTLGRSVKNNISCDLSCEVPDIYKSYDLIIHAAGRAHATAKSIEEERMFYKVNYNGTENLLKAIDQNGNYPKSFVYISSVAVYGQERGELIDEEFPLLAQDGYGKSKVLAEEIVKNWGYKNNIIITILRLPLVFGKKPPGNLGSMINMIKKKCFFLIGNGDAHRSMVYAEDVGKFIFNIYKAGGIFNLTDGVNPTYSELSNIIANHYSTHVYIVPIWFGKLLASIGDIIQKMTNKDMPFNTKRFTKMTSSLTFSDIKARKFGWSCDPIPSISNKWLS